VGVGGVVDDVGDATRGVVLVVDLAGNVERAAFLRDVKTGEMNRNILQKREHTYLKEEKEEERESRRYH
jgi:hypothetical protein